MSQITPATPVLTVNPGQAPVAEPASAVQATDTVLVVDPAQPVVALTGAAVLAAITPPAQPGVITFANVTQTSMEVAWPTQPDAAGFTFSYGTGGTFTAPVAASSPFSVSGLSPQTTINVQIVAIGSNGLSSVPATASQETLPAFIPLSTRTIKNGDPSNAVPAGTVLTTFHAFAPGAVPAGFVPAIQVDGVPVSVDVNNVRANADGSTRCCVLRWAHPNAVPAAGSDSVVVGELPGTLPTQVPGDTSLITAHAYALQVTIGGTLYTLSANAAVAAGTLRQTRFGAFPEWTVRGELLDANGNAQGQAWGMLYISKRGNGTLKVLGKLYCNRVASATALSVASYALMDGGTVLFQNTTPFTLYTTNVVWTVDTDGRAPGAQDQVVVAHDIVAQSYLTDSGMLLKGLTVTAALATASAALTAPNWSYTPNQTAAYAGAVDNTGAAPNIGIIDQWSISALATGLYTHVRAARQQALCLTNFASFWASDAATGFPPVLLPTSYPGLPAPSVTMGWGVTPTLTMSGGHLVGSTNGPSHAATAGWGMYLLTGEEEWLDLMFEQVIGALASFNPSQDFYGRNPKYQGVVRNAVVAGQPMMRGIAWHLRSNSNAAHVVPDSHPMAQYVEDLLAGQVPALNAYTLDNPEWAALSIYDARDFVAGGFMSVASPWMHDYFGIVASLMVQRGQLAPTDPIIVGHVQKWILGRATDSGNMCNAVTYRLGLGQGANPVAGGAYAQSWGQVYGFDDPPAGLNTQAFPASGAPTSGWQAPLKGAGHTYPNIFACMVSACEASGIDGGRAAPILAYVAANDPTAGATAAQQAANGLQWCIRAA